MHQCNLTAGKSNTLCLSYCSWHAVVTHCVFCVQLWEFQWEVWSRVQGLQTDTSDSPFQAGISTQRQRRLRYTLPEQRYSGGSRILARRGGGGSVAWSWPQGVRCGRVGWPPPRKPGKVRNLTLEREKWRKLIRVRMCWCAARFAIVVK